MPNVQTRMNAISKSVILVVDDDALVRVHSNLTLEDAGYEVVEASNAADALMKLEERPDIATLFTDVRMPGALNGIDLANAVHAQRPDIAILVTSGTDKCTTDVLPKAAQFVKKPYSGAQLTRLLQR
ncbi:MAG TPA: response regulator [Sphingomonas sp.]|nr:response regulator [Sphingomonas sp.]